MGPARFVQIVSIGMLSLLSVVLLLFGSYLSRTEGDGAILLSAMSLGVALAALCIGKWRIFNPNAATTQAAATPTGLPRMVTRFITVSSWLWVVAGLAAWQIVSPETMPSQLTLVGALLALFFGFFLWLQQHANR